MGDVSERRPAQVDLGEGLQDRQLEPARPVLPRPEARALWRRHGLRTFDYFTAAINGEEGNSRTDYQATEDDNVTVQGVSGDKGALGYFGLSYLQAHRDKLKAVQVKNDQGECVTPSSASVRDGEYVPLARPLFIYPSDAALARPEVKAFVEFFVENQAELTQQALFVPMTPEQLSESQDRIARLAGGN